MSKIINENPEWVDVPLLSTDDLVLGGEDGPSNKQAKALDARTRFLKNQTTSLSEVTETLQTGQKRSPLYFATLAEATAAVATLADGYIVEIESDESNGGQRTRYVVQSAGLVFKGFTQSTMSGRALYCDLPLINDAYKSILAANGHPTITGSGYIYPGSFGVDEKNNELFVYMGSSWVGNSYVFVYDLKTFAFKGYVQTVRSYCEGIAVTDYYGSRKLFVADTNKGNLYEYTFPVKTVYSGAELTSPVIRQVGVHSQFSFNPDDGTWLIEQKNSAVGQWVSRNNLLICDKSFNPIGTISHDISLSSYGTMTTNAVATNWPKRQGFAHRKGVIITAHGASWDSGNPIVPAVYQGTRRLTSGGEVIEESIGYPDKFRKKLLKLVGGLPTGRIENEGCVILSDGTVLALYVHRNRYTSNHETGGIAIVKEYQRQGPFVDFSEAEVSATNLEHWTNQVGVFPRSHDGLRNPDSGALFTSVDQILDYIALSNRKMFTFYTSSSNVIKTIDGKDLSDIGICVRITNLNGLTFLYEAFDYNSGMHHSKTAYIYGTSGSRQYLPIKSEVRDLTVSNYPNTEVKEKLGRILTNTYLGDDKFLGIDIQANSENHNLFLGGGSSVYKSATQICFFTATDITSEGIARWGITKTGDFIPYYVDNTYKLGAGHSRIKEIYAANSVINTSDGREKTSPLVIDDAVLDAWGDVQIICYRWLEAIAQKGEDYARWHFGVIAQQVRDAFATHGIDGTRYGLLCYDEWEATPEVLDNEGNVLEAARDSGSRWGIRADQCLFLEAAYQRRELQRVKARLHDLEELVARDAN